MRLDIEGCIDLLLLLLLLFFIYLISTFPSRVSKADTLLQSLFATKSWLEFPCDCFEESCIDVVLV
jgi:hypothetical protein